MNDQKEPSQVDSGFLYALAAERAVCRGVSRAAAELAAVAAVNAVCDAIADRQEPLPSLIISALWARHPEDIDLPRSLEDGEIILAEHFRSAPPTLEKIDVSEIEQRWPTGDEPPELDPDDVCQICGIALDGYDGGGPCCDKCTEEQDRAEENNAGMAGGCHRPAVSLEDGIDSHDLADRCEAMLAAGTGRRLLVPSANELGCPTTALRHAAINSAYLDVIVVAGEELVELSELARSRNRRRAEDQTTQAIRRA